LAPGLRLIDIGLRTPRTIRRVVRGLAIRALASRLPSMLATYEDRAFLISAGDTMYSTVFFDDEYDRMCCDLLRVWLRPGDCVVDVGANHGWFSLLMAAVVGPAGVVIASEPMPEMLRALRANLSINSRLRVRVMPLAFGAEAGELELHMFAGLPHGHASVSTLGRTDYVATSAPVQLFDAALADEEPRFVKLDVEGAELDVLRGASSALAGPRPPSWLIEVNYETSLAMGYRPADLHRYLTALHDYELYRVVSGGLIAERRPEDAPQGCSWLFVSRVDRDRLARVSIIGAD
jgi:FkbM family methyltransferase